MAQLEDVLPIGTEVSAKFKGAFCEAKIRNIKQILNVKVQLKEHPYGPYTTDSKDFKEGTKFRANEVTEVKIGDRFVKCSIQSTKNVHLYTVVFNDGDVKVLKRNNMVLKSGKHFDADGNLDAMPLTNPESFSTPVFRGATRRAAQRLRGSNSSAPSSSGSTVRPRNNQSEQEEEDGDDEEEEEEDDEAMSRRERRRAANAASAAIGELNDAQGPDTQSEESAADSSEEKERAKERRRKREEEKAGPSNSVSQRALSIDSDEAGPSTSNGITTTKPDKRKKEKKDKTRNSRKGNSKLQSKFRNAKISRKFRNALKGMEESAPPIENLHHFYNLQGSRSLKKVLTRKSIGYNMRVKRYGRRKKYKRTIRTSTWRLRNVQFRRDWRRNVSKLLLKDRCKNWKLWSRRKLEDIKAMKIALMHVSTQEQRDQIRTWTTGVRRISKWKIVVFFKDPQVVRKVLSYLTLPDGCTLDDRFEVERDDVKLPRLAKLLQNEEWYLGVLFPFSRQVEGRRNKQRLVHDLNRNTWDLHWEYDLLPFSWVPPYSDSEKMRIASLRHVYKDSFRNQWTFCSTLETRQANTEFIRQVCQLSSRPYKHYKKITKNTGSLSKHPPPDESDEVEDESDDDYDSDASIKAADEDTKALFVARLLEFLEFRGDPPPFKIQEIDVDMFYFHHLIKKFGGVKKAGQYGNHWGVFAKKLVPKAVNAEDELRELYSKSLCPFMTIDVKLLLSSNNSLAQPRSERKVVRPGQYSELRKKKTVVVSEEVSTNAPSSSNSVVTSAKKSGRGGGRGRKRKSSTGDRSEYRNKRDRQSDTRKTPSRKDGSRSRESTVSPEPRGSAFDSDEEDTASSLLSADGNDKKRTSLKQKTIPKNKKSKAAAPLSTQSNSRTSRSVSVRRDDFSTAVPQQPPKKGRPRKNAVTLAPPPKTPVKQQPKQKECDMTGFTFANILTHVYSTQELKVCTTDGGWWEATAIDETEDFGDEIMAVMLKEQREHPGRNTLSNNTNRELYDIFDKMKVKTHYKGWNQRYDEQIVMKKLMVKEEDQMESRRRFRWLSNGAELEPRTMSLVEQQFTFQSVVRDAGVIRPNITSEYFTRKAEEALKSEEQSAVKTPKVVIKRDRHRTLVESDDDDYDEDSEDDHKKEDKRESDESDKEEENKEKGDTDDDENEEKDRPSTSDVVARQVFESDESDEDSEDDDFDKTIVPREQKGRQEDTKEETNSSRNSTLERDIDSDFDGPEYPPGPSSPQLPKAPVLQNNAFSFDRISSSGSSNFPVLSRQTSSTSVSVAAGANTSMPAVQTLFTPPNVLAHSGPLTLDEVQPAMAPASSALVKQRHDNSMDANKEEKRKGAEMKDESEDDEDKEPMPKKVRVHNLPVPPTVNSSQFSSGALTLDIPPPVERSGPIESIPTPSKKGRKKTGTPNIQKISPSISSSGPLTLSPSKSRPPGASPLGRPKKKSLPEPSPITANMPSTSTETEDLIHEPPTTDVAIAVQTSETIATGSISGKESQDGTSGSTTPATTDDKEDEVGPIGKEGEQHQSESPAQVAQRGFGGSTRGKRKRGGRFANFSTKVTPKSSRKKDENNDENDDEPTTPTSITVSTPQHSYRLDSFLVQKKMMAKKMEQEGSLDDYTLLDLISPFDMTLKNVPPEDVPLVLEERANELKDLHVHVKQESTTLDKQWRKQNLRKEAEAVVSSSSSSTSTSK